MHHAMSQANNLIKRLRFRLAIFFFDLYPGCAKQLLH